MCNIKYVYSEELLKEADKNPAVKQRASLTHSLIESYGLLERMKIVPAKSCNTCDLSTFHSEDYVLQLKQYEHIKDEESENSCNSEDLNAEQHGLSYDCPPWKGLKTYACAIAGATMTACELLCKSKERDIVINWTGGWHHAWRQRAAGFCYVNDIVLGIMVLRTQFQRVLYIDLDVHHGDAVEHAFAFSRSVFTLSFHQYECGYFPGTGAATHCGSGRAKGYSANFPYRSGITGDSFSHYFKRVTSRIFETYQPEVCVVQCGADALVGDPLGGTNLIPADLIACLQFIWNHKLSTLLLGGGGYNFANASRLWTLITAAAVKKELEDDIPCENEHFLDYGPDYSLSIERSKILKNLNIETELEDAAKIIEHNLMQYQVSPYKT